MNYEQMLVDARAALAALEAEAVELDRKQRGMRRMVEGLSVLLGLAPVAPHMPRRGKTDLPQKGQQSAKNPPLAPVAQDHATPPPSR